MVLGFRKTDRQVTLDTLESEINKAKDTDDTKKKITALVEARNQFLALRDEKNPDIGRYTRLADKLAEMMATVKDMAVLKTAEILSRELHKFLKTGGHQE